MISTGADARAVAETWLRKNGPQFRYEHLSTNREAEGWVLVFAVFDLAGHAIDGPGVLIVDPQSGAVSTTFG